MLSNIELLEKELGVLKGDTTGELSFFGKKNEVTQW
jgi:hypothetical protein